MSIWKCLLFWKFWYKVGQCQTRNGEMVAILNFGFCFVPTYCVFSIFGKALPPFKATFLQEIFLRHQSYDISDVRRSQGLQKMVCNNGWCHLPERSCWRKMGVPFFLGRRKYINFKRIGGRGSKMVQIPKTKFFHNHRAHTHLMKV